MAFEGPQTNFTFKAGGTIVQYQFVKLSAAMTVIACAAATDKPIGVAQEAAVNGAAVPVCLFGVTKVEGAADLAFADSVGTSSGAQAATYTASDTTKYIVGVVLSDNAAQGGYATIMFYGPGRTLA